MLDKKGSILIAAYLVLFVLLILGGVFITRSVTDNKLFNINRERMEGLYVAEAGVEKAISELKANFDYSGIATPVAFGRGEYEVEITNLSTSRRKIISYGYIPSQANVRVERQIEAVVKKETPPDFFDSAIYSADEVDFNGNSYTVTGNVMYANEIDNSGNVSGTITNDPTISPLARFDFTTLRDIAITQGNLYDTARLKAVQRGEDSYPTTFWNVVPTGDPLDPATGVPNVVYVEGDMVLNGNIGTAGGFFVVVGDVLTNPSATYDSTINGNGLVSGCIYTTGDFKINGGAGGLNVDGGVWSGSEAEMNGNAAIAYNHDFMYSIKALIENNGAGDVVQLMSWRELR